MAVGKMISDFKAVGRALLNTPYDRANKSVRTAAGYTVSVVGDAISRVASSTPVRAAGTIVRRVVPFAGLGAIAFFVSPAAAGVAGAIQYGDGILYNRSSVEESPVPSEGRRSEGPVPSESRRSESPVPSEGRRSEGPVPSEGRRSESTVPSESRRSESPVGTPAPEDDDVIITGTSQGKPRLSVSVKRERLKSVRRTELAKTGLQRELAQLKAQVAGTNQEPSEGRQLRSSRST